MKRFSLIVPVMAWALLCMEPAFAKEKAKKEETPEERSAAVYKYLNIFSETLKRTKTDYVEEVQEDKLIEYAINGMLSSLDPHSSYLDAETFKDMREQTKGEFGGLGIDSASASGGSGSIPGQKIKTPHATRHSQKKLFHRNRKSSGGCQGLEEGGIE